MVKVRFLSKQQIEWNADRLLAEFGDRFGTVEHPPVPVEEILETHLKLSMEFDNLASRLGFPDIMGALWAPERLVAIDESLDPEEHPDKEGRYRYTMGHEIGHWEQHRHYFLPDANQSDLFPNLPREPSVICRTSQSKEPIEWQADYFSACLLMPRHMVVAAWEQGQTNQLSYVFTRGTIDHWRALRTVGSPQAAAAFEVVSGDLARGFGVSKQAMRIRLEELSLFRRDQDSLFSPEMMG